MSDPNTYTVGWICALEVEYVAAQEVLDEEHERPSCVSPNDYNDYTLGKILDHNVVIAVLPDGEYGLTSAGKVATSMLHSFPNIRIGLLVGIGGGVPSERHDIRLGDIVVSAPGNGHGGVFQYDFGKSVQEEAFQYTGFLNQPPTILRTALTGLQAQYKRKGHRLKEAVFDILNKNPRLCQDYARPPLNTDRLFKADVKHDPRGCDSHCAYTPSNLLLRPERTKLQDDPAIHYGLVASANRLMKDASLRDKLANEDERDVLCFEMEAAGLSNTFPCLVIRGICDYSDSHKNKEWQGYAAMVAAVYAKDLLNRIVPNKIEHERKIKDVISGLQDVVESHGAIVQKQLTIQIKAAEKKWTKEQEECLQLFRLTSGSRDITYEWYKDRIETRVDGTCEWLIQHPNFEKWLEHDDSGPLLISADPGCGKSVLAKYLVDERLARSESVTVCYFFFKDQDQNTVQQALCALIHQLLLKNPPLIRHAMDEYKINGPGLVNSTMSLWNILENSIRDPQAGQVTIVLDALDECAESDFQSLVHRIKNQFNHGRGDRHRLMLKYLLTSRPYEQVVSRFGGLADSFPYIRIPGEEESERISHEVNLVIQHRMERLAKLKGLSEPVKNTLEERLLGMPHRTYLWVYLVFDHLAREILKKTVNGIRSSIDSLPKDVNEAYEKLLMKSAGQATMTVRKALGIILAASRPLTILELNIALNIDHQTKCFSDLDLEEDGDFKYRLRHLCGLFISVHQHKVYLIHQTAREFLLATSSNPTINIAHEARWRSSFTAKATHKLLTEICVTYLNWLNHDDAPTGHNAEEIRSIDRFNIFFPYSAENWTHHFREADIDPEDAIIASVMEICNPESTSCSMWFADHYWKDRIDDHIEGHTPLMIASHFGHETVVKLLLERNVDVNSKNNLGSTPLFEAVSNGHEAVQTLIEMAIGGGNEVFVKLILEKNIDVEAKTSQLESPLILAARTGQEGIVKLLIAKGADVNFQDKFRETSLILAASHGHESIVRLLLENGADMEAKGGYGMTALGRAALLKHDAIVNLLLEKGADPATKYDLSHRI